MNSIFKIGMRGIHQTHISLIHQRGGLKCVAGRLASHVVPRHAMEFLVNQRHEFFERGFVPIVPGLEKSRHFARSRACHRNLRVLWGQSSKVNTLILVYLIFLQRPGLAPFTRYGQKKTWQRLGAPGAWTFTASTIKARSSVTT